MHKVDFIFVCFAICTYMYMSDISFFFFFSFFFFLVDDALYDAQRYEDFWVISFVSDLGVWKDILVGWAIRFVSFFLYFTCLALKLMMFI